MLEKGRKETGQRGEDLAARYVEEMGMEIVARNWRSGHREVDIIAMDGRTVRFVEVRTRRYPHLIAPAESVGARKRSLILAAAKAFMSGGWKNVLPGRPSGMEAAFDVVSIVINGDFYKLEYIRDAYAPTW